LAFIEVKVSAPDDRCAHIHESVQEKVTQVIESASETAEEVELHK